MRFKYKLVDYYEGREEIAYTYGIKSATSFAREWYEQTDGECDLALYKYNPDLLGEPWELVKGWTY